MALVIKKIVELYQYVFTDLPDPRLDNMFLMNSIWPSLALLAIYAHFVLISGPAFMKDRKPFKLRKLLLAYNLMQVIGCGYVVLELAKPIFYEISWKCSPVDYSNNAKAVHLVEMAHFYFIFKVIDLLDTVFFVLKKNDRQITFLHLYHHMGMVFVVWVGARYLAGGHSMFIPFINSFVHTVMYFYYMLTNINKEYKKNVWWKKYITQIQLAQFFLLFVIFTQVIFRPSCGFPKWICMVLVPNFFMITTLFADFYYKAYIQKKQNNKVS